MTGFELASLQQQMHRHAEREMRTHAQPLPYFVTMLLSAAVGFPLGVWLGRFIP